MSLSLGVFGVVKLMCWRLRRCQLDGNKYESTLVSASTNSKSSTTRLCLSTARKVQRIHRGWKK